MHNLNSAKMGISKKMKGNMPILQFAPLNSLVELSIVVGRIEVLSHYRLKLFSSPQTVVINLMIRLLKWKLISFLLHAMQKPYSNCIKYGTISINILFKVRVV